MKKKRLLIVLILILTTRIAFANNRDSAAVKEVRAIEMKRFDAQVHKDYAYLEEVFSPDLVYIHASGKVNTKDEYIQSIKDGKSMYEKIDVEAMKLRSYNKGKTVVINGMIVITLPPVDGKPNLAHLKYAVVYIKKNDWQLVMWQSLKLTE